MFTHVGKEEREGKVGRAERGETEPEGETREKSRQESRDKVKAGGAGRARLGGIRWNHSQEGAADIKDGVQGANWEGQAAQQGWR